MGVTHQNLNSLELRISRNCCEIYIVACKGSFIFQKRKEKRTAEKRTKRSQWNKRGGIILSNRNDNIQLGVLGFFALLSCSMLLICWRGMSLEEKKKGGELRDKFLFFAVKEVQQEASVLPIPPFASAVEMKKTKTTTTTVSDHSLMPITITIIIINILRMNRTLCDTQNQRNHTEAAHKRFLLWSLSTNKQNILQKKRNGSSGNSFEMSVSKQKKKKKRNTQKTNHNNGKTTISQIEWRSHLAVELSVCRGAAVTVWLLGSTTEKRKYQKVLIRATKHDLSTEW